MSIKARNQRNQYFDGLKNKNKQIYVEKKKQETKNLVKKLLIQSKKKNTQLYDILKDLKLKDFVNIYLRYKKDLKTSTKKNYLFIKTRRDFFKAYLRNYKKLLKRKKTNKK
jgi:hypothetical protein